MKVLLYILFFISCSSIDIQRHPLSEQILRVRTDYPEMLTNYDGKSIVAYDMNDKTFREKLIEFGFVCKIAGKRFRICKDRAGFCRWERECEQKKLFLWCSKYKETFIPASDHKYLLDAKVVCEQK